MLLKELLKNRTVILGSQSPRRRELLAQAGIEFITAENFDTDESFPEGMNVEKVPVFLSELKAEAYPHPLERDQILITADTVVALNGAVIGKPSDREEAIRILSKLSGRSHQVITGVTITGHERQKSFSAVSHVFFRHLLQDEIEYYVDNFRPYDKAGAYGIQEWIGCVGIERIEGSYYNVMGLPVQRLYMEMMEYLRLD